MSGYASMGSAESLADMAREKMVVTRHHQVREAVEKVRDQGQRKFKSEFAKELDCKQDHRKDLKTKTDIHGLKKTGISETMLNECAKADLVRLKLENEQLKLKIQKCLLEDERYKNLQHEVEQLTLKVSKVIKQERSVLLLCLASTNLGGSQIEALFSRSPHLFFFPPPPHNVQTSLHEPVVP